MSKTLLSLTKDQAIVGENVQVFSRENVEHDLPLFQAQLEKDTAALEEVRKRCDELTASVQRLTEVVALFGDLKTQFDLNFPEEAHEAATEEAAEAPETTKTAETPEPPVSEEAEEVVDVTEEQVQAAEVVEGDPFEQADKGAATEDNK